MSKPTGPRIDLTNMHFGKWTVKSYVELSKWNCICDCGYEAVVNVRSIRLGKSTQCWKCGKKHNGGIKLLPKGEAAFNKVYDGYVRNAKKRRLFWGLDKPLARLFFKLPCVYCGQENSNLADYKFNGSFSYNGIDRINPLLGYVSTNCVPCCNICNWMKTNFSKDDFLKHINKISNVQKEIPCL